MRNIVNRRPNKGGYSPLGVAIPSTISVGAIAAESGDPAMLDTAWNFSIPCVSFPEGGAIPAGNYSYNGLYNPEINPATGTTYLQWDLSTTTPVTCSTSPNCADVAGQFNQIRIPEVTFGTNSFYAAILDPVTTDAGSTEAGLTDGNEVHCHPQPWKHLITALLQFMVLLAFSGHGSTVMGAPLYSFSVKTTGTYGTGSTSGSTEASSYPEGQPITLVAKAASGSTFAGWTPAGICTSSFTMPAHDLVCTATFNQLPFYTLQVKANGRGKITSNALGGLYDSKFQEGTVIDLNAELIENPSEWYFSGWSPAPCAKSFKMPKKNLTCTATFLLRTYPFSVKIGGLGKGTVTGSTASGNYAAGTTITLGVPTPEPGSVFVGWTPEACRTSSKGGAIFSKGGTFIMPVVGESLECIANFSVPVKLSVRTGGTGAGNFSVGFLPIMLSNQYVSGISGNPSLYIEGRTRYDNDSVSGDYFSLSAKPTDAIDYINSDYSVGYRGTPIMVKSTFKGWIPSNLCGMGAFTMHAQDKSCTAIFDRISYTFNTATAGSGKGSVVGTAHGSYAAGTLISLSVKADPGSVFTRWEPVASKFSQWEATSLNGCSTSFKLYSNTVCTAYFEIGYAFNTATDGTGTGTVTGSANGDYAAGQTINLVATPTGPSAFTGWSAGCSNSFSMPAKNLTCTANFTVTHPLNTATTGTGAGTVLVTAANVVERLIYTVAGNGIKYSDHGYRGDGGLATNAQLQFLSALVADSKGNLYFIQDGDGGGTLRKIDATGIINQVMVMGKDKYIGLFGSADNDLAVDNSGNLYITAAYDNKILKIDENGIISTAVGNGTEGYSGDGGLAANAQLSFPLYIAIDSNNNLYIVDYGNDCIRKVDTNGIISTVAGRGSQGRWDYNGLATNVQFNHLNKIALDRSGNLYIAEEHQIRKVDTTGMISNIAGSDTSGYSEDGGPAINAKLSWVNSIALDDHGNLYIRDRSSTRIRKVDTKGIISTLSPSKEGSDGAAAPTDTFAIDLTFNDDNLYFLSRLVNSDSDFLHSPVIRKIELLGNKGLTYYYLSGTPISLTATPKKGSVFAGWSPGCAEPFTMPAGGITCTAIFNLENDSTVTEGSSAIITEDSKIGIITDTCPNASLDNEFNLKIPCVKVNEVQYAVELHYMGKVDNNPYWRLDSAINSDCTWDANTCAVMDDESQVTLPNISIDGVHTTVQFKPYPDPTAPNELFWKYEGVPATTH